MKHKILSTAATILAVALPLTVATPAFAAPTVQAPAAVSHDVASKVKAPKIAPVDRTVTINASSYVFVSPGETFDPYANVTAVTASGEDVTPFIKVKGKVKLDVLGTYKLTYSVTYYGKTSKFVRTVIVTELYDH